MPRDHNSALMHGLAMNGCSRHDKQWRARRERAAPRRRIRNRVVVVFAPRRQRHHCGRRSVSGFLQLAFAHGDVVHHGADGLVAGRNSHERRSNGNRQSETDRPLAPAWHARRTLRLPPRIVAAAGGRVDRLPGYAGAGCHARVVRYSLDRRHAWRRAASSRISALDTVCMGHS